MSTTLDEQRIGPHDADPWLMLLLGLISLVERLDPFLAPRVYGKKAHTGELDDALAALLGVAALKEHFEGEIEAVAPPLDRSPAPPVGPIDNGSLLR